MGKPRTANHLFLYAEPYPEHAKVYPYSQFDIIEEFFDHLRDAGITDLTWVEVHDLILDFKGVNRLAYEAEGADMTVKYRHLFDQFGFSSDEQVPPRLRVTRPKAPAPQAPEPQAAEPAGVSAISFLFSKIAQSRESQE